MEKILSVCSEMFNLPLGLFKLPCQEMNKRVPGLGLFYLNYFNYVFIFFPELLLSFFLFQILGTDKKK